MSSLTELRQGIADNIANITGLRSVYYVPDNVNPPIAIIEPTGINYDSVFNRGLDEYSFKVTVIVGRASERSAQNSIDDYCTGTGSKSIKRAIESDRTLNGKCNDLRVTALTLYGSVTISETPYLAAEFAVTVYSI